MRYNHMFDVAFSVETEEADPDKVPLHILRQGLRDRLSVLEGSDVESYEAFGHCDTYEIEEED